MWAASEFSFSGVARVQIYTTAMCPYCVRAKRLLAALDAAGELTGLREESG